MTSFAENTKYEVCFVQTGSSANDVTEKLQLAFEAMESNQIDPVWISAQECLQITKKEPKLFVIDPFEGEVYEHLKSVSCRIVGPLCILYCLKCEDVLPKRPYPVYSVSMRKVTVSCSNIDTKSREDISKKVECMGGFFSKDLTKSVTHLVVGEVGSKKYQVAASCGLLIMVPDWINAIWESGQHSLLHATDSSFDKYKCPVFKGLIITVSQLSAEERAAIKSLVERNGGIYMGALKARETTHLVLSEPSGDKYRYARNWKVFCVNVSWIYDSIEAGYCKDETLYTIDENSKPFQPKRSTPKKDFSTDDLPFPLVDCSAITNVSVITHLDETIRSDASGPVHRKTSFSALESFDLSSLPKYGQFLDGCKIFLTGFSPVHIDKLRKIVNAGGGIRFSKYSDSISHVVCGELSEDFLQNLKSSTVKPYVVNCNWLLECCKKEKLVEEKPFLCMDISHLSPEKVEPESKEIGPNKSINSLSKNENITGDNITDIFKQYINHETLEVQNLDTVNDKKIDKSIESHDGTKSVDKGKERGTLRADEEEDDILDVNEEDAVTSSKELFTGLKFTVAGFGDKDSEILAIMIETHSGVVLYDENIHFCDIAIVPIIWSDNISVPHILTNCWLQKCIEDCRLYDFDQNELFRPLTVPLDKKPFQSFVISVSQYSGTERDCLMYLAEALGAVCQEYFVRRANKSKGVLSNTHLIVATPEGSKYEAAKKWNIPAVTKQWVLDAAKHGTIPPISKYMVEAAALPMEHDTKSSSSSKNAAIEKINGPSTHEKFNCIDASISEGNHMSKPTDETEQNNQKTVSVPVINSDKPLNKISELDQLCKVKADSVPVINSEKSLNKLSELDQSCKITPLSPVINPDNSLNSTLDQSYNIKFHVSGLLRDLDSSMSDSPACSKRKSLPVEELFRRNLASAVRGLNATLQSEADGDPQESEKSNIEEIQEREVSTTDGVLKGVVLCVSRKLINLQAKLNEIVSSLGGDYLCSYDSTCTHFVFTGKSNDLAKEFREARCQGKKIVSPEWLYDCKKQNLWLNEELYPHSLKTNMSLAGEISIVKMSGSQNNSVQEQKEKQPNHEESLKENDTIDFNKQLKELLVAATISCKSDNKRQSKRLIKSFCASPVNEVNPIQKYPRHFSDAYVKSMSSIENNAASDEPDTCSQHSQSYPVTWDDPTGRLEREKIAARAAANNHNLISVKQNLQESLNSGITVQNTEKELDLKNVNFNDIDNEISVEAETVPVQIVRKFMFTNIPEPEKTNYTEIIQNLGGTVSDEKTFDITATHLILRNPIKNEKLLSSIASGKWILHPDYLKESDVQKRFLPEIDFEWGGPGTSKYMQNVAPNSEKLAKCPIRWRMKLNGNKDVFGAFHGWKVVVFAEDKAKLSTYTKILEAGGAEIVPTSDANSALDTISHVFVEVKKKCGCKVDLTSFVSHNIKCLKPEYLAFYLTEDSLPEVDNFILAEAKELMDISTSSSKRHAASSATRLSKRSRVK